MNNLDEAAELICDPDIREGQRDRLAAEYAAQWAAGELHLDPEEDVELVRGIGELIALAMLKQHEQTMRGLEEANKANDTRD